MKATPSQFIPALAAAMLAVSMDAIPTATKMPRLFNGSKPSRKKETKERNRERDRKAKAKAKGRKP
jgi:hypothetical protein